MKSNRTLRENLLELAKIESRIKVLEARIKRIQDRKEELRLLEERARQLKLEQRRKEFNALPARLQAEFRRVGWDPVANNESRIIRREFGTMKVVK